MAKIDDGDVQNLTATLQAKWYNALVAQLGVNPQRFQLLQPSAPLGDTSDLLWAYFNNLPPQTLAQSFTVSGGNRLYDDYRAVLSQLSSQNDGSFRRDVGDIYQAWIDYVGALNPPPRPADLPSVFQAWGMIHAPDVAEQGATDLSNGLNDPIFLANQVVRNQTGFINEVPNFSETIRDLRDALQGAESRSIDFDSSTASSDVTNTWARGSVEGFWDIFSGKASASYSRLTSKAASSRFTVKGTFTHVLTFSTDPGLWYSSAALGAAFATRDNTLWKHGTPNWLTTFGATGNMRYVTSSLVVVDGIDMTITSEAEFSSEDQTEIRAQLQIGIWPFFGLGASGGYDHVVNFDSRGKMSVKISNQPHNPVVMGATVVSAQEWLASGAQLRREAARLAFATVGVPANSELNFGGRPTGYVLRISKSMWGPHPVTFVIRDQGGATIAAGHVSAGQADSGDILVRPNTDFTVYNVGVWPLTVRHP